MKTWRGMPSPRHGARATDARQQRAVVPDAGFARGSAAGLARRVQGGELHAGDRLSAAGHFLTEEDWVVDAPAAAVMVFAARCAGAGA